MIDEVWREVPESNGRYEISNYGRLRSYFYYKQIHTIPLLKQFFISNVGYVNYKLVMHGKSSTYSAHRLVMLAFVGPSKLTVNHKDGNKLNNYLSNLEYMTRSENMQHSFDKLGRKTKKGENAGNARLKDKQIEWLRKLASEGKSNRDLVEIFDISFNHASRLKMGHTRE